MCFTQAFQNFPVYASWLHNIRKEINYLIYSTSGMEILPEFSVISVNFSFLSLGQKILGPQMVLHEIFYECVQRGIFKWSRSKALTTLLMGCAT